MKKKIGEQSKALGFFKTGIVRPGESLPEHLLLSSDIDVNTSSIIMVALSYNTPESAESHALPPGFGKIAPFAQSHYYREVINRLKQLAGFIQESAYRATMNNRIFSNSRFPEKLLAVESGLGFIGRNSLLITREGGSLCVLGGIVVPFELESDAPIKDGLNAGSHCSSCNACMKACPTHAIEPEGKINRGLCIQSLSSSCVPLPEEIMEVWGSRIYGCQTCQEVCPFNSKIVGGVPSAVGKIGPSISLEYLLKAPEDTLKKDLKKTAMGRRWIDKSALKRNALIACGNQNARFLIPWVKKSLESENPVLRQTAAWSLKRLT